MRALSRILSLFFVSVCIFSQWGCGRVSEDRAIYGQIPLESQTLEVEEFCKTLKLPEGSSRVGTRIISKSYMGLAISRYSTDYHCEEIDTFFRKTLLDDEWQSKVFEKTGIFWIDTYSVYKRNGIGIEIACNELSGLLSKREFTLGCRWGK